MGRSQSRKARFARVPGRPLHSRRARPIETDLAIIGGGPAGIALALALANTPIRMLMLESGGSDFDAARKRSMPAAKPAFPISSSTLAAALSRRQQQSLGRLWCRPLDAIDFEQRNWLPHSGWPFGREALEPYFARAQSLVRGRPLHLRRSAKWTRAGRADPARRRRRLHDLFPVQQAARQHPAHAFRRTLRRRSEAHAESERDAACQRHRIAAAPNAASLDHLDVATLQGADFTVRPKYTVLAVGGIETRGCCLRPTTS
jgi:choline dehydrogenase-like flavoprotein